MAFNRYKYQISDIGKCIISDIGWEKWNRYIGYWLKQEYHISDIGWKQLICQYANLTPYSFSIGGCPFTSVNLPFKESTDNALTTLNHLTYDLHFQHDLDLGCAGVAGQDCTCMSKVKVKSNFIWTSQFVVFYLALR